MQSDESRRLNEILPGIWAMLSVPQELACDYFAVFSRLEFALKATGFAKDDRGRAKADWTSFAKVAAAAYAASDSPVLAGAIAKLNASPPMVQVVGPDGRAKFAAAKREKDSHSELEVAIGYALRVRNNLFHGGKYFELDQVSRNEDLVACALTVLLEAADLVVEVGHTFQHGDG